MKRGKEAKVLTKDPIATEIELRGRIKALQQRCEELEAELQTWIRVDEEGAAGLAVSLIYAEQKIAALEGALEFYADTKSYMKGAPEVEHGVAVSEPLSDIEYDRGTKARQALSAREESGEKSALEDAKDIAGDKLRLLRETVEKRAREEPGEWAPGIECEHGYDACPICDAQPKSDPKIDQQFSKKFGTGRQGEGSEDA